MVLCVVGAVGLGVAAWRFPKFRTWLIGAAGGLLVVAGGLMGLRRLQKGVERGKDRREAREELREETEQHHRDTEERNRRNEDRTAEAAADVGAATGEKPKEAEPTSPQERERRLRELGDPWE